MKMKFTVTAERILSLKDYPGAKTPEDALEMQRGMMRGAVSAFDIVGEEFDVKIELVE